MRLLADLVLLLHAALAAFIVGATLLVPLGNYLGWRGVNAHRFRLLHLAAIVFVAVEAWIGVVCPLTVFENWLRRQAGGEGYGGGFIAHWVGRALYYDLPGWVFVAAYTALAVLVAGFWRIYPPRR